MFIIQKVSVHMRLNDSKRLNTTCLYSVKNWMKSMRWWPICLRNFRVLLLVFYKIDLNREDMNFLYMIYILDSRNCLNSPRACSALSVWLWEFRFEVGVQASSLKHRLESCVHPEWFRGLPEQSALVLKEVVLWINVLNRTKLMSCVINSLSKWINASYLKCWITNFNFQDNNQL